MNAEELNAIKERAEKATPGKWEVCNGTDVFTPLGTTNKDGITANQNDGWHISRCNEGSTTVGGEEVELSFVESNANATFIAHAREDIPALIAEVERLKERLEDCEVLLSWSHDVLDDVHCDETDVYVAISKYLYDEEDSE